MNKTLFNANKNVLTVTRTFDAPVNLVWRAWTEAKLLDQWWAPKPWRSQTKRMDFTIGGQRLYAMIGPEGEEHWGLTDYLAINVQHSFSGEDAFCDSEGKINEALPIAVFNNRFEETADKTIVKVITKYASEDHLQQVIQMGMKEGLTMAYENLDSVLNGIKKSE